MVPSKLKSELAEAFDAMKLQQISKEISSSESLNTVLFDIFTRENFIAGIACSILSDEILSVKTDWLRRPFIRDHQWISRDGHEFDLKSLPELFDYAVNIENVRRLLLEIIVMPGKRDGYI